MAAMPSYPITLLFFFLFIVSVLSNACSALTALSPFEDACDGDDHGTAGDFELYVLSQSWSAEFCYSHREYPGCVNPTPWQRVNLTLHGLWPQYSTDRAGDGQTAADLTHLLLSFLSDTNAHLRLCLRLAAVLRI
jgi:ribonuclease I